MITRTFVDLLRDYLHYAGTTGFKVKVIELKPFDFELIRSQLELEPAKTIDFVHAHGVTQLVKGDQE